MTVKELIENLSHADPDLDVEFVYDYHDFWRTTVTRSIRLVADGHVQYSDYHKQNQWLDDNNDHDAETIDDPTSVPPVKKVIVLL